MAVPTTVDGIRRARASSREATLVLKGQPLSCLLRKCLALRSAEAIEGEGRESRRNSNFAEAEQDTQRRLGGAMETA
jgi:hypothetical protein